MDQDVKNLMVELARDAITHIPTPIVDYESCKITVTLSNYYGVDIELVKRVLQQAWQHG